MRMLGISLKQIFGIVLTIITSVCFVGQVTFGWFSYLLVDEGSRMAYALVIIFMYAFSFALTRNGMARTLKYLLYGVVAMLIPVIVMSSVFAGLDMMGLTSYGVSDYPFPPLWGLSQVSTTMADVSLIIQVIISAIPGILLLWGVISIYYSDTTDDLITAIIETVVAGGVLFLFVFLFTSIGVPLF